jgi:hypothetical protein
MVGIADALRDHADPHVTIVDQPGLLLGTGSRRRVSSGINELASLVNQAAFIHLHDEVVDGGALYLAVADRPAQDVVGFVDRGVLAVRLPLDQDG